MEGKKIEKVLELGESVVLCKMDDGTYLSAKIIDPEIPADIVGEFFEDGVPEKPVTKSDKKPKKEKSQPEPEKDEPEDDDLTWEDISDMSVKALKKVIKEKDLLTDPDDFEDDDDGLKKAVAEELDIEVPEEEEPEGGEDTDEEDSYTWNDLTEMDYDELSELCHESDLDTDPDDFDEGDEDSEDKFRRAIAKECGIEVPERKKKTKK